MAKGRLEKGESLYKPDLIDRVKTLIIEMQPIKSNGELHLGKVAKVLGVPRSTFDLWRKRESNYYKPDFDKAIIDSHKELIEGLQAGRIKQAMIKRAQPYLRVKKTRELRTVGPEMPKMGKMTKPQLIKAAKRLKVEIGKKDKKDDIKAKIAEFVETGTVDKLVVVKQEEEQMHGDVSAAKFVLPHIGPKADRWTETQKLDIEGQSLADIAAIMMGKKAG